MSQNISQTNAIQMIAMVLLMLALTNVGSAQDNETTLINLRKKQSAKLVEPKYKSFPTYSLVAIGPDAGHSIWLVLDGFDILYADLDGDCDLTDKAEKFVVDRKSKPRPAGMRHSFSNYFSIGSVKEVELSLEVFVPNPEFVTETKEQQASRDLYDKRGWRDAGLTRLPGFAGRKSMIHLLFCRMPADSQVTWIGGPLSIYSSLELRGKEWEIKRQTKMPNDRVVPDTVLVDIGTLGLATKHAPDKAFTSISHFEIPDGIHPVARFAFDSGDVTFPLDHPTGGGAFFGTVAVPESESAKTINVELAFPGWKEKNVKPTTRSIPIR